MRPSRQVVLAGNTLTFIVDYMQSNISIQAVPTGGATYSAQYTADDPNDSTVTPTWFNVPNMNAATTAVFSPVSQQPIRALLFSVSVGGSVAFTVLQASGSDGVAVGADI